MKRMLWSAPLLFSVLIAGSDWASDATKVQSGESEYESRVLYHEQDEDDYTPARAAFIPEAILDSLEALDAALPAEKQRTLVEAMFFYGERAEAMRDPQDRPQPRGSIDTRRHDLVVGAWQERGAAALADVGGSCDFFVGGWHSEERPRSNLANTTTAPSLFRGVVKQRVPVYADALATSLATLYYIEIQEVFQTDDPTLRPGRVVAVPETEGAVRIGGLTYCSKQPPSLYLEEGADAFVYGHIWIDSTHTVLLGVLFEIQGGRLQPVESGGISIPLSAAVQRAREPAP